MRAEKNEIIIQQTYTSVMLEIEAIQGYYIPAYKIQ